MLTAQSIHYIKEHIGFVRVHLFSKTKSIFLSKHKSSLNTRNLARFTEIFFKENTGAEEFAGQEITERIRTLIQIILFTYAHTCLYK